MQDSDGPEQFDDTHPEHPDEIDHPESPEESLLDEAGAGDEPYSVQVGGTVQPQQGVNVGDPEVLEAREEGEFHKGANPLRDGLMVLGGSLLFAAVFLGVFFSFFDVRQSTPVSPEVRASYDSIARISEDAIRQRANGGITSETLATGGQDRYSGEYFRINTTVASAGTVVEPEDASVPWEEPAVRYIAAGEKGRLIALMPERLIAETRRPERVRQGDRITIFGVVPERRVFERFALPVTEEVAEQVGVQADELVAFYPRLVLSFEDE